MYQRFRSDGPEDISESYHCIDLSQGQPVSESNQYASFALLGALALALASLFSLAAVWCFEWSPGVSMVLAVVALAAWAGSSPNWRGMAYALVVFAFVTAGVCFPESLRSWSVPSTLRPLVVGPLAFPGERLDLKLLIAPLIQFIMFGMGTTLSLGDFVRVTRFPKIVLVGLLLQFTVMPLVGLALAAVLQLPAAVAAGVVLVGCCPGGVASNVIVYLGRGNVALSVTLTACSSLLAPVMTPWLINALAGSWLTQSAVATPLGPLFWTIFKIIVLPIAAGLLVHHLFAGGSRRLEAILPVLAVVAIGLVVGVITAHARPQLLQVAGPLLVAIIAHNAAGFLLGYWGARLLGAAPIEARTVSVEVGMQNSGLAAALSSEVFRSASMALPAALFSPWMNVTGSLLAGYWRRAINPTTNQ